MQLRVCNKQGRVRIGGIWGLKPKHHMVTRGSEQFQVKASSAKLRKTTCMFHFSFARLLRFRINLLLLLTSVDHKNWKLVDSLLLPHFLHFGCYEFLRKLLMLVLIESLNTELDNLDFETSKYRINTISEYGDMRKIMVTCLVGMTWIIRKIINLLVLIERMWECYAKLPMCLCMIWFKLVYKWTLAWFFAYVYAYALDFVLVGLRCTRWNTKTCSRFAMKLPRWRMEMGRGWIIWIVEKWFDHCSL